IFSSKKITLIPVGEVTPLYTKKSKPIVAQNGVLGSIQLDAFHFFFFFTRVDLEAYLIATNFTATKSSPGPYCAQREYEYGAISPLAATYILHALLQELDAS
ncbi:hypothetical protein ACJX0J_039519, partial [Zea mays]